ncbi:nucleoid-associated protein [Paraflavisolibacter sp. H34]|uniref:nucleoid-associated protein n=1 Tax=Huijunlia imazamoxiresistens TaxID=3127457 RepID=UPI003015AC2D
METNFKAASLKSLIVHYVGSKNNLDPLYLSEETLALDEEMLQVVGESFLNKFNNAAEYFKFSHPSSLQFNEVYNYAEQLFEHRDELVALSTSIAKHLYESSTHPKVKGGELYVGLFEGLPVDGRIYKAVGLFKTENKSLFLDAQHKESNFELEIKEGVELTKIDKGCLIINNNPTEGYDVLIFDNQNRGEEAQYWKEKFLQLAPQKNEFHQTNHMLTLTKQYITEQMESEFNLDKTDQIELLTKSIDYFKSKESFDIEEFQTEVFQSDEMIESFRDFGSRYTQQHDIDISAGFDISGQAVKKQMRVYKSVLKLDRNFHVYIHGNTDLIEKGVDDNGRKYYKLYYEEES